MGNVSLPTPVALAGGGLCLLAGYLVGVVAGPDTTIRTTATVESYDDGTKELCLVGEGITDQPGVVDESLCGVWRRQGNDPRPQVGDEFRFVSTVSEDGDNSATYIYGAVVE